MDYKDYRILLELMRNPFQIYEDIGSAVSLTGLSVKNRIAKMKKSGLMKGFHIIPAPITFGKKGVSIVFSSPKIHEIDITELLKIEGVVFIWLDHNEHLIVNTYERGDYSSVLGELSAKIGGKAHDHSVSMPMTISSLNSSKESISSIDWKILEHLVSEPRISISDISKRTNLSRRTIKRHRDSMVQNHQIFPIYIVDCTQASEMLFGVYCSFKEENAVNSLVSRNLSLVWLTNNPSGAYLLGYANSLLQVGKLMAKISANPAIKNYSLSIPVGGIFAEERIKSWIRDQIEQWKASSFGKT